MKHFSYILFFSLFSSIGFGQSYLLYRSDTINRIDRDNKKQGNWIEFSKSPKCNADGIVLEKGAYLNNHKTGVWDVFYCNGVLKTKLPFVHGRPDGEVSIYYENGNLHETGIWKNNKWVGKYKEYDTSGKYIRMQELDSLGRKEGLSIFSFTEYEPFLVNGEAILYNTKKQLLKEGVFKENRLIDGKVYIYDEKGDLARTTLYMAGVYVGDLQK